MAHVTLKSYIRSISGRMGSVVFYSYGNRQYMRRYVVPANPDTPAQRSRRELFAAAVLSWQSLAPYKKAQWNYRAGTRVLSGYNMFISSRMKDDVCSGSGAVDGLFGFSSYWLPSHSVLGSGSLRFGSGMGYDMRERARRTIYAGVFPSATQ
ncbi:MAG TPA: hypothetical protein VF857_01700 [Spirochaetota bacterium]